VPRGDFAPRCKRDLQRWQLDAMPRMMLFRGLIALPDSIDRIYAAFTGDGRPQRSI